MFDNKEFSKKMIVVNAKIKRLGNSEAVLSTLGALLKNADRSITKEQQEQTLQDLNNIEKIIDSMLILQPRQKEEQIRIENTLLEYVDFINTFDKKNLMLDDAHLIKTRTLVAKFEIDKYKEEYGEDDFIKDKEDKFDFLENILSAITKDIDESIN